MKGFLIKVCDFLEKFGVKLFAIRYILTSISRRAT